jgi:hypothetical protein
MYGEVFVNGEKSHMPYGSYVSSMQLHLLSNLQFFSLFFSFLPCSFSLMHGFNLFPYSGLCIKNSSWYFFLAYVFALFMPNLNRVKVIQRQSGSLLLATLS